MLLVHVQDVLIDERFALTGSMNLTERGVDINVEAMNAFRYGDVMKTMARRWSGVIERIAFARGVSYRPSPGHQAKKSATTAITDTAVQQFHQESELRLRKKRHKHEVAEREREIELRKKEREQAIEDFKHRHEVAALELEHRRRVAELKMVVLTQEVLKRSSSSEPALWKDYPER